MSPPPSIDYVHRIEIGEIVSSILLKGNSETSNDQALLIPFDHHIKMKACTMVEGGGTLYPGVECPPLTQVNFDCVHRDEI